MKYRIQIPGKTFCFGEYAALVGGPALLLATKPGFEMILKTAEGLTQNPFHPLSPAGRYFEKNKDFFNDWQVEFIDHYQGRGGFGASTAQFLGLCYFKRQMFSDNVPDRLYFNVWNEYKSINRELKPDSKLTQQPSGYDLWSQMLGGTSLIQPEKTDDLVRFQNSKYQWPFEELSYVIVPTGFKVPTHDHLNSLNSESIAGLALKSEELAKAWSEKNQSEFLNQLRNWSETLMSLGLVHSYSLELLEKLEMHPEILVVKGCGAMGADLLFLVFMHRDYERIKIILSELQLRESYDQSDLWETEIKVQAI